MLSWHLSVVPFTSFPVGEEPGEIDEGKLTPHAGQGVTSGDRWGKEVRRDFGGFKGHVELPGCSCHSRSG